MMQQNKSASGFTLVELIITFGIMAVVATIGMANYFGERGARRLQVSTEILVRELNFTMERSRAQEDGKQWWIHFDNSVGNGNDFYAVCYGVYTASAANCALEGGSESKRTSLGTGLDFTNPSELEAFKDIVFAKATGLLVSPTAVTITISSAAGAGSSTITVNPNGSITF